MKREGPGSLTEPGTLNGRETDSSRVVDFTPLSVPDLPPDVDALTAALAYAECGFYVLPVRRTDPKNPGSVVGKGWPAKSSRDPKVIAAWFAGTDHNIALHLGRSGAVAFDVDDPDKMPDVLAAACSSVPYQSSRPNTPGRGHYVFRQPRGRTLGNGTGRLAGGWGEVRGLNGVIVVAPSWHPDRGEYLWQRLGPVPVLPDELAELLDDASPADDAATDGQIAAFLTACVGNSRPGALAALVKALMDKYAAGESRHASTVTSLTGACKEARAGLYPATAAVEAIEAMFMAAVARNPVSGKQSAPRVGPEAESEWRGMLAWAVGQALAADLDAVRTRVDDKLPDNWAWLNNLGTTAQADPSPIADDGPQADDEAAFWDSCNELRACRDYARAVRVGPWAMLGSALCIAAATIPPFVVLPGLVGAPAPVNIFAGLVGPSGGIKSAAIAAARNWLRAIPTPPEIKPGSGQGIAKSFAFVKRTKKGDPVQVGRHWTAVAKVGEVDTLTAAGSMTGSSLWAELRSAWSGERVGHDYADATKTVVLQPHRYRLCMIVGVQPLRARPLFADADAGTPQRFLWLPTGDPDAPAVRPEQVPSPLTLTRWPTSESLFAVDQQWADRLHEQLDPTSPDDELIVLTVPPDARAAVDAAALATLQRVPGTDPLDGHRLLCRLKVAAALMRLCQRDTVTAEDWERAGTVMAISDRTREQVRAEIAADDARRNVRAAEASGTRKVVESKVVAEAEAENIARVAARIVGTLERAEGRSLAGGEVRRALGRDGPLMGKALDYLTVDGRVRVEPVEYRGQTGIRVTLLDDEQTQ